MKSHATACILGCFGAFLVACGAGSGAPDVTVSRDTTETADGSGDIAEVPLGAPCTQNAQCADDQVCAASTEGGTCVSACVTACPEGAGLRVFDGCHCRTAPLFFEVAAEICSDGRVAAERVVSLAADPWAEGVDDGLVRGLIWRGQRMPGVLSQTAAAAACDAYVDATGAGGWRLPTAPELFGMLAPDAWGQGFHSALDWGWGEDLDPVWTSTNHPDGQGFVVDPVDDSIIRSDPATPRPFYCVRPRFTPGPAAGARSVPLIDETVVDRATGLAWRFASAGAPGTLETAAVACATLGPAWHLPRIEELVSVLRYDGSATTSRLWPSELGAAGEATLERAWSVTIRREGYVDDAACFAVDFVTGEVAATSHLDAAGALCVRETTDGDGLRDDGDASGQPGDAPCHDSSSVFGPPCDDSCPGVYNPDQADTDDDGVGDACDPCDFGSSTCIDHCLYATLCPPGACGAFLRYNVPVLCGACASDERCSEGACVPATCTVDSDCASDDVRALPSGVERGCDTDAGACVFRIADDAEVLTAFQRIYHGASAYLKRPDRLLANGSPDPCLFPANQGVTPIEGTCCRAIGGPDHEDDGLCDADPTAWSSAVWSSLGYGMADAHAATYDWQRLAACGTAPMPDDELFAAHAYEDLDCDNLQSTFTVVGRSGAAVDELAAPAALALHLAGPTHSADGTVTLTPAQQAAFLPPAGTVTLNPYAAEVEGNLARLAKAAATYYAAQPAGACAFPAAQGVTPIEGTCCDHQGGPDADGDWACDANPTPWATPTWEALGFSIDTAHRYVYTFGTPVHGWFDDPLPLPPGTVTVAAFADLDCDTLQSTFVRFVRGEDTPDGCKASVVPGVHIEYENE